VKEPESVARLRGSELAGAFAAGRVKVPESVAWLRGSELAGAFAAGRVKVPDSVARLRRAPPCGANRKDLGLILRAAYAASAIGARLSLATVILDR